MIFNKEKDSFLYFFEQISAIPRESGNEKAVSDYIKNRCFDLGLKVYQYPDTYSLIIEKEPSCGFEDAETVILQAHLDMVCEKTVESVHDFEKDAIPLMLDGDMIRSAAGTSLGADDGIGVAYCMAVLEDDSILHPRIQVVLTTQEETTFAGIECIEASRIKGKKVINIDHCADHQMVIGSCGGVGVSITLLLDQTEISTDKYTEYEIEISDLPGGHSGEDIHKGRGTAIQLMARMLRQLNQSFDLKLIGADGGTNRLAIARNAKASILIQTSQVQRCLQYANHLAAVFQKEYKAAAPNMMIMIKKAVTTEPKAQHARYVYTDEAFKKMLAFLSVAPDGLQRMNGIAPGIVESSLNLGIIHVKDERAYFEFEVRGAYESTIEDICERLRQVCALFEGEIQFFDRYVPWECQVDSPLQMLADQVYKGLFHTGMEALALHAGLECGFFAAMDPETDAISIGPNCWNFHSPEEHFSVSSAKKTWEFLVELLKNMR